MKRRDLLGAFIPGAIVGSTAVAALLATNDTSAADPWMSSCGPPLTHEQYRDELERVTAAAILHRETIVAEMPEAKHIHALFQFENNGLFIALRLLGGYGWGAFDTAWARGVIAAKGEPRSEGLSWADLPGGPLYDTLARAA
jgi:hypothetical protein